MTLEKYLTVEEIAELLRCHVETVRRRIKRGLIPAIRNGKRFLVNLDDFDEYKKSLRVFGGYQ